MKKVLLSLILVVFMFGCRKVSTEIVEGTIQKKVGRKIGLSIANTTIDQLNDFGFSRNVKAFILKDFDDDLIKKFLQRCSEDKAFLTYSKNRVDFLKTWKIFSNTNFELDQKQIRWIQSSLDNDKFLLKRKRGEIQILDLKTRNIVGSFKNNKLITISGRGGKDLNPILNIHPLIPNTEIVTKQVSAHTDGYGRVSKMVSKNLSKSINVERNVLEQFKAKELKNGIKELDELGDVVKVKSGYVKYKDDGGHIIANMFGGASEQFNYVPMSSEVNKKAFKKLENFLSKCIDDGKKVENFTVILKYKGKTGRPDAFFISYFVDSKHFTQKILNN